jgi:tetratricopeptide (TPR) repeat protein
MQLEDKDRNVIPRWRDFRTTIAIGELDTSGEAIQGVEFSEEDALASKIRDWEANKTVPFASDLVSAAFTLGRYEEAADAAAFLLSLDDGVPEAARSLAKRLVSPEPGGNRLSASEAICDPEPQRVRELIRTLRHRLRDEPRNTVAYVDLARAYTLLDHRSQARRSIEMALKLSPENRFVLRSAARFYIHSGDLDTAHKLLRRAEATKFDPWLLAAEISVASAAEHPARFAKTGLRLLADDAHAPLEVNELASALATLEMESGKSRDARKLFRRALISPTENSVAQIEWASRRIAGLDFVNSADFENVPRIYEARAWEHLGIGEWDKALKNAWNWFYDQPFSSRPADLGSYIASALLGDYRQGAELAKGGLVANPHDPTLLNNLAFCYASSGRVKEAAEVFGRIDLLNLPAKLQVPVTATSGLIAFRSGRVAEGRAKYLKAIELAERGGKELQAMAAIYYAREEKLAKTLDAVKARERVLNEIENLESARVRTVFERELGEGTEATREATKSGEMQV